ncbi:MAG TPA: UDP-N-acetylmuramoyl-L-alanyl-D-glutamate--2,6-diaminopimelate ligase [Bryobacteraceae bacterium]|nr:UDP-N-acetylmuramoyl-L-alanyl-D-glutamate--2,6-diaminopimelate ligase [Bryobacteraceae bacterium]
MTIHELLDGAGVVFASSPDTLSLPVHGLAYHSAQAGPGTLFFAFSGSKVDGGRYASDAFARGAVAVVYDVAPAEPPEHPYVVVAHGRRALAVAAKRFYGAPDETIDIIAFTGTNGKSTGTMLADGILQHAGYKTSLINTIGYHVAGRPIPAVNTTPESLDVFRMAAETRDLGGRFLSMEISSHALALGRVEGLRVAAAVFTNLTRDHLDFHHTMDEYFAAKARLFSSDFVPRFAILNADDEWTQRIEVSSASARRTYGIANPADYRAIDIESGFFGLRFTIEGHAKIESRLVGDINIYNILAAAAACRSLGLSWDEIAAGVAAFPGVPGRFERVEAGQDFLVAVDYAHTDAAITNVIRVARQLLNGKGRVLTLFGCGGDRDRSKRPLMGMAAAKDSDFVILTSDNPRSEDPFAIINDAVVGARRFDTPLLVEPDREKAIHAAIAEARPGDIVLLTGKGHENYQIIGSRKIEFSDRDVALRALRARGVQ